MAVVWERVLDVGVGVVRVLGVGSGGRVWEVGFELLVWFGHVGSEI